MVRKREYDYAVKLEETLGGDKDFVMDNWENYTPVGKLEATSFTLDLLTLSRIKSIDAFTLKYYNVSKTVNELLIRGIKHLEAELQELN